MKVLGTIKDKRKGISFCAGKVEKDMYKKFKEIEAGMAAKKDKRVKTVFKCISHSPIRPICE